MLSFVDFRMKFVMLSTPFLTQHPWWLKMAFLLCTRSWVSITTILISPPFTFGPPMSHIPFSSVFKHWPLSKVLDPRISYEGLKADYIQDADLLADLDKAKSMLHTFYRDNYSSFTSRTDKNPSTTVPVMQNGSPQKVDFTARYKRTNRWVSDELEDYFKLGQEDFDMCWPLDWWWGRRAQFPNLYHLAQDILAMSGELFLLRFHFTWD